MLSSMTWLFTVETAKGGAILDHMILGTTISARFRLARIPNPDYFAGQVDDGRDMTVQFHARRTDAIIDAFRNFCLAGHLAHVDNVIVGQSKLYRAVLPGLHIL